MYDFVEWYRVKFVVEFTAVKCLRRTNSSKCTGGKGFYVTRTLDGIIISVRTHYIENITTAVVRTDGRTDGKCVNEIGQMRSGERSTVKSVIDYGTGWTDGRTDGRSDAEGFKTLDANLNQDILCGV